MRNVSTNFLRFLTVYSVLYALEQSSHKVSPFALALEVNRTVDDAFGGDASVRFTYVGRWNIGQQCTDCFVRPDKAEALDGTWHDATYNTASPGPISLLVDFVGTAIYVFCILANNIPNAGTNTKLGFLMDGVPGENFNHAPSSSSVVYEYNVLVYSQTGLSNTSHTLTVNLLGGSGVAGSSLMLFDYITYTQLAEDSFTQERLSSASPSSPSATRALPSTPFASNISHISTTSSNSSEPIFSQPMSSQATNGISQGNPPTGSPHSDNGQHPRDIAPLVGGVVGGSLVMLVSAISLYFCTRRARASRVIEGMPKSPEGSLASPSTKTSFGIRTILAFLRRERNPGSIVTPYPQEMITTISTSSSYPDLKRGHQSSAERIWQGVDDVEQAITLLKTTNILHNYQSGSGASTLGSQRVSNTGAPSPSTNPTDDDAGLEAQVQALRDELVNLRVRYESNPAVIHSVVMIRDGENDTLPRYEQ